MHDLGFLARCIILNFMDSYLSHYLRVRVKKIKNSKIATPTFLILYMTHSFCSESAYFQHFALLDSCIRIAFPILRTF